MDLFDLPNLNVYNKLFYANGSAWQVWNKPNNSKFVYIFAIGGGGGGGGGRTSAITSATGGGGGGGSAITISLFPSSMLPDTIYIQVGLGGAGGSPSILGSAGGITYLSSQPNTTALNILLQNGSAGANGGGAGGTTVQGAGGTGGTIWANSSFVFGNLGLLSSDAGQTGASGGVQSADGGSLSPTLICTGGAGGKGSFGSGGGGGGGSYNGTGGAGGNGSPIATTFFGPTAPSYGTPGPAPGRWFAGGAGGTTCGGGGTGGAGGGAPGTSRGNGTVNTGGAGAGYTAGSGGSGIVVIRYKFK